MTTGNFALGIRPHRRSLILQRVVKTTWNREVERVRYEMKGRGPEIAKEMVWLAWKACGGPIGMGVLQDQPNATKEDVWKSMACRGDYNCVSDLPKAGKVDADYVFGRMMKLRFSFNADSVTCANSKPNPEYQGWCRTYPTYEDLVIEACLLTGELPTVDDTKLET